MCSGIIITVGLMVASLAAGFYALLGSAVGSLTAYLLGVPSEEVYAGLWGYDACLAAIAAGGMFPNK